MWRNVALVFSICVACDASHESEAVTEKEAVPAAPKVETADAPPKVLKPKEGTDWAKDNLFGRPRLVEYGSGGRKEFDEDGRYLAYKSGSRSTKWTYDDQGRLITEVSDSVLPVVGDIHSEDTTLEWDAAGRPIRIRTVLDAEGDKHPLIKTRKYDERGLLIDDGLGVRFTYSVNGKLLSEESDSHRDDYLRTVSEGLQVEVRIRVPTQKELEYLDKVGTREEHTTRRERHIDALGRTVLSRYTERGIVTSEEHTTFDSVDAEGNWLTATHTGFADGERKERKERRTISYWD